MIQTYYEVKNYKEFRDVLEFFEILGFRFFGTQVLKLQGWHGGIYYPESTEILIKVV